MGSAVDTRRSALIAYGTETGNAQDSAEDVGRLCERLRFKTHVVELDLISLKQLLQHTIVVFVISTTGQGELPANSQKFWRLLRSARLPPGCLQRLQFTSFGLGDSSYTQFNWAHKKLTNRLLQLGAQVVCDRAESDEQQAEGVDGAFIPWLTQLRGRLLDKYPLPSSVTAIPDDVLLEPKWTLQRVNDSAKLSTNGAVGLTNHVSNDIPATIASNERVTSPKHWQDVRHLTLHLDGNHAYVPGDVMVIQPKNFPIDVDQILETCAWASIADDEIQFTPTNQEGYDHDAKDYPTAPIPSLQNARFTLRDLLTNHLDIMSIPRRSFFAHLVHYSNDDFHVERLKEFINPELIDELFDYTTRPRRSILEVLDEFRSVKLPWQKICSIIPILRGRQFSIASGGVLKLCPDPATTATPKTKVELLIAIVKYKTVIKRVREGVCTRYVASLHSGQQISVLLQKGGLHPKESDMLKPVVMIGPGTGVAPMRSLIYERARWRKDHEHAVEQGLEDLLFFGCRNEASDYFFKEEWARFEAVGSLKTFVAFSRDQRQKVYVQDLVRQQSARVYRALAEKGGMVYVCGSSGKMPSAVREALIESIQKEGNMSRDDAEGYFVKMEKEARYKQETW